ncbi:DUF4044 domain-containing protein [Jeotgalibaca sp. MA1X17-3]|nr:DUF4044 domain-containing protein [Jeotgalibaca sp. MA1X17-3]UJF14885.1 DUF4044 domain-containing protein [Jeotgalibaca sp. MA1X17-3]
MSKNKKSTTSKFNKMSKVVIWIMLFAMVGSGVLTALYSLFINK